MPKATKSSAQRATPEPTHDEMTTSSQDEHSSSDQEPVPDITFHPSRQLQPVPSRFMQYIEGPKMDWTVNDGLYHGFLKWHLKYENILECKLAALPECPAVQECDCMVRRLWHGQICVLGLANRPFNTR